MEREFYDEKNILTGETEYVLRGQHEGEQYLVRMHVYPPAGREASGRCINILSPEMVRLNPNGNTGDYIRFAELPASLQDRMNGLHQALGPETHRAVWGEGGKAVRYNAAKDYDHAAERAAKLIQEWDGVSLDDLRPILDEIPREIHPILNTLKDRNTVPEEYRGTVTGEKEYRNEGNSDDYTTDGMEIIAIGGDGSALVREVRSFNYEGVDNEDYSITTVGKAFAAFDKFNDAAIEKHFKEERDRMDAERNAYEPGEEEYLAIYEGYREDIGGNGIPPETTFEEYLGSNDWQGKSAASAYLEKMQRDNEAAAKVEPEKPSPKKPTGGIGM